eukprot:3653986-Pyramimonas_sp.AAC.1
MLLIKRRRGFEPPRKASRRASRQRRQGGKGARKCRTRGPQTREGTLLGPGSDLPTSGAAPAPW